MNEPLDFVAIGDTAVDEFIRLKDATVHCDIDNENCTISMKWGDKLPFEYSVLVPGVGNAANAAVSAARLGLSSGFISNVGKDRYGEETLASFTKEKVATDYVHVNENLPTNHHYVLWYESERTILIKHEEYPYVMPEHFAAPRWIYLSSAGAKSEAFHGELTTWLLAHPETKLAFQPGTFQMSMGRTKLAELYKRTDFLALNKEEAERVLECGKDDVKNLLKNLYALGSKIVLITDGPKGGYAYDGTEMLMVPMYPDPKPPFERTGAGDACTSTIVAALAMGKPLKEALLWGPVNSMSVVQEIGAQKGLLSKEALEKYLAEKPESYKVSDF
jgi:ribokinase